MFASTHTDLTDFPAYLETYGTLPNMFADPAEHNTLPLPCGVDLKV